MTALPLRPSMNIEEYLQLDKTSIEVRYEYINGHVTMLAGGTANHATIGANVISILHHLLRGGPCCVFTSDLRVQLSETRYVYPDVTISCDERDRGRVEKIQHPRLIVEILSPSTEAYDRGRKFAYYRQCPTIQEYVLIDSQHQDVEVYRREKNRFWTFHAFEPDDDVELVSLGVRFPIAAVYENVLFSEEDNSHL